MLQDTKQLGQWGELTARQHLSEKGYTILDYNYRTPIGELDIIAWKNKTLVFVEVKTRDAINADYFLPEQSITKHKQSKLKKLCEMYLTQHHYGSNQEWQIDIISITLNKVTKEAHINHIQNAIYG